MEAWGLEDEFGDLGPLGVGLEVEVSDLGPLGVGAMRVTYTTTYLK